MYYYMPAFQNDSINYCHIISKCPVWSEILCYVIFVLWLLQAVYCHTFWIVCSCLYGVTAYLHTSYFFIFVSLWFCLKSQSAMKRSGPGLYIILILYWCILRRIPCSLCYSVVISFFVILPLVACDLWLYSPLLQSSNDGIF